MSNLNKNNEEINIEDLSKEDLIKLYYQMKEKQAATDEALNTANSELEDTKKKLAKQEVENRKLQKKLDKKIAELESKKEIIKKLQANTFGRKRESLTEFVEEDIVINEAEGIEDKTEAEESEDVKPYTSTEPSSKKRGRKKGSKNFITDLKPDRVVIRELTIEERTCPSCGSIMKEIGRDSCKKIIRHPARYEVVEYITIKYSCNKCKDKFAQALNNDVFPHTPITPSVTADVIHKKFILGSPLYRYSKVLNDEGMPISEQVLSNALLRASELLTPLYERLRYHLLNNHAQVIHADETPLQLIDVKKQKKTYIFVYTTSFWDKPIFMYDFTGARDRASVKDFLNGYKGYLVTDGYKVYNKDELEIKGLQRCLVHDRRMFFDVLKGAKNEKQRKESKAYKAVQLLDKIFHEEKTYKNKDYTVDEILAARNTPKYDKLVKDFINHVKSIKPVPDSLLEDAVDYTKKLLPELFTYRENGYIDCSNNIIEREGVKPFIIARKNFLFVKSVRGADATGILFSICQTARANGLDVKKYLNYCMENINNPAMDIDSLLPWNEKITENMMLDFDTLLKK